jgi:hypothetical protein
LHGKFLIEDDKEEEEDKTVEAAVVRSFGHGLHAAAEAAPIALDVVSASHGSQTIAPVTL